MTYRIDDMLFIRGDSIRATPNLVRCEAQAWREVAEAAWVLGRSPVALLALDATLPVALKAIMLARWGSHAPLARPGSRQPTPDERVIYCEWFALEAEEDAATLEAEEDAATLEAGGCP